MGRGARTARGRLLGLGGAILLLLVGDYAWRFVGRYRDLTTLFEDGWRAPLVPLYDQVQFSLDLIAIAAALTLALLLTRGGLARWRGGRPGGR